LKTKIRNLDEYLILSALFDSILYHLSPLERQHILTYCYAPVDISFFQESFTLTDVKASQPYQIGDC